MPTWLCSLRNKANGGAYVLVNLLVWVKRYFSSQLSFLGTQLKWEDWNGLEGFLPHLSLTCSRPCTARPCLRPTSYHSPLHSLWPSCPAFTQLLPQPGSGPLRLPPAWGHLPSRAALALFIQSLPPHLRSTPCPRSIASLLHVPSRAP